jgi:hypothetical protein
MTVNTAEFEIWIRDTIDGRLYWEDLIERTLQGRVPCKALDAYEQARHDDIDAGSYDAGFDAGYQNGFAEGYEEGLSDGGD